jgi:hypothetical protein
MPKKRAQSSKQTASKRDAGKAMTSSRNRGEAELPPPVPLANPSEPAPVGTVKPLPPGTPGNEIPIPAASFQQMLAAAAVEGNPGTQVWVQRGAELLVVTGKVQAALDDGLVVISIPVSCDQVASALIQIPFAMGGKAAPAGMVCATEERPRGPAAIVDTWGEALISFAWRLLLTVATRVAAQSGADQDGVGLIPAAISATKDAITLLPMARHRFDRVPS